MTVREQIQGLREAIRAIAAEHGAREIRVFGSVARGEEEEDRSDIDFLVSLEPNRTLMDLSRLEIWLEALLGRRVDVVPESALRDPFRSTVLREAVNVQWSASCAPAPSALGRLK